MQAISDTECSLEKRKGPWSSIPILIANKFRRSLKALQVQGSGVSLLPRKEPIKEHNKNNYILVASKSSITTIIVRSKIDEVSIIQYIDSQESLIPQ